MNYPGVSKIFLKAFTEEAGDQWGESEKDVTKEIRLERSYAAGFEDRGEAKIGSL